jgi:hypothetical protein
MLCKYTVTIKIQASFSCPERKEPPQGFHHEANGDFKTVAEFNGCDRRWTRNSAVTLQY